MGGNRFRPLAGLAGAVCVALAPGCRTGGGVDDLRSTLPVDQAELRPSLVVGYRFGRWLEIEPERASTAALERACLLEQTGACEEAMKVLSRALEELLDCPSLFEARGALYLAAGFPRAAAGDFQSAVGLGPERPSAWYALGHAYQLLGLSRQALEALARARGLGEDGAGLFLSEARAHRALGRTGQAARGYEQALERLEGNSSDVLVEAAVLATEDRARAAEIESLRERLESCRGTTLSDDAWLLRALLKELPGASRAEVRTALRALEIAPEELAELTQGLLVAVQLVDAETRTEARARLLASEPSDERRVQIERCLARL